MPSRHPYRHTYPQLPKAQYKQTVACLSACVSSTWDDISKHIQLGHIIPSATNSVNIPVDTYTIYRMKKEKELDLLVFHNQDLNARLSNTLSTSSKLWSKIIRFLWFHSSHTEAHHIHHPPPSKQTSLSQVVTLTLEEMSCRIFMLWERDAYPAINTIPHLSCKCACK